MFRGFNLKSYYTLFRTTTRPELKEFTCHTRAISRGPQETLMPRNSHSDSREPSISKQTVKRGFSTRLAEYATSQGAHLVLCSSTSDIKEVCRCASMHLDDVHRCHCQASSIHHAAYLTIQSNVIQIGLCCCHISAPGATVNHAGSSESYFLQT